MICQNLQELEFVLSVSPWAPSHHGRGPFLVAVEEAASRLEYTEKAAEKGWAKTRF